MIKTTVYKRIPRKRYQYGGPSYSNQSKYRYGGGGILTNLIGRMTKGDAIKKLINTVGKSNIIHKASNAIQEGATNAVKAQTQKRVEDFATSVINSGGSSKKKQKRSKEASDTVKALVQSIPTIHSGKGIVYD